MSVQGAVWRMNETLNLLTMKAETQTTSLPITNERAKEKLKLKVRESEKMVQRGGRSVVFRHFVRKPIGVGLFPKDSGQMLVPDP